MNACACTGPMNGEPVCPCRMPEWRRNCDRVGMMATPGYWEALGRALKAAPALPAQDRSNDPPSAF